MTAIIKILKNITASPLSVLNVELAPNATYTLPYGQFNKAADSIILRDQVSSGQVSVNNGSEDLSIPEALIHLTRFSPDTAEILPFDNSGTGFSSTTVQGAIQEARQSSVGSLLTMSFQRQGSAGNSWLYSGDSGITLNTTPIVIPFSCKLVGASISNDSNSRSFDINVNISKFGTGNTVDRTVVYPVRSARSLTKTDFNTVDSRLNLDAGDKISVYCRTVSAAPKDLIVTLTFKVLSDTDTTKTENYSTDTTITIGPITITLG